MNLEELKAIIERDGGKVIVVEQGNPVLVVMSFEEYRKKAEGGQVLRAAEASTEQPRAQEQGDLPAHELTIDDLPV